MTRMKYQSRFGFDRKIFAPLPHLEQIFILKSEMETLKR